MDDWRVLPESSNRAEGQSGFPSTKTATAAITALTHAIDVSDRGGLRITSERSSDNYNLSIAQQPADDDRVVSAKRGATVFLDHRQTLGQIYPLIGVSDVVDQQVSASGRRSPDLMANALITGFQRIGDSGAAGPHGSRL